MPERLTFFYYKGKKCDIGYPVKVLPSRAGKHDGFDAKILAILGEKGKVVGIEVKDPRTGGIRTFSPARVVPYLKMTKRVKMIGGR
jgi:uncharacterized protein YuzE